LDAAAYADQGNFQLAVETLEQAIQLQAQKSSSIALWPIAKQINMTALLTCRALCKFALGPEHDQDATESLKDLLNLVSECSQSGFFLALAPGQINLVQALLERKQYDLAEKLVQYTYAAVRLNPHHPASSGVLQVYEQLLVATNRGYWPV
jgi:tetratricopeptide (TPR) repeat protein